MTDRKIRRALVAVYDKTGVAEFARALVDEFGIEIISTGGTAKHLKEAGIPVTLVEQVTGFPEMLDGRVKTLHPKIHAAILADRDNPDHMRQLAEQGIEPIDMVVVNLYPFEKTVADPNCTFEQAIEMIDIGGPCLLRAAAKNSRHVALLPRPDMYPLALMAMRQNGTLFPEAQLAACHAESVFEVTAQYDISIMQWLAHYAGGSPRNVPLWLFNYGDLRYGENPHQEARLLASTDDATRGIAKAGVWGHDGEVDLSFNNYADADAALGLCAELTRAQGRVWHRLIAGAGSRELNGAAEQWHRLLAGATPSTFPSTPAPAVRAKTPSCGDGRDCVACFIKHTNACGAAMEADAIEAYRKAYLGDPNAAMGGILAVNFEVTTSFAETVMETYQRWGKSAGAGGFFVEVWIAPSFDEQAVDVIRTKKEWGKRVRLLQVGDMGGAPNADAMIYRSIAGGMLVQTPDVVGLDEDQWKVVTQRAPTETEMADLRLAWLVCKHTKSNAITVCKNGMLIGNGAGQMSRVMSCRIATWLAKENGHAEQLPGAVAASDAFFPFRDGPDILMEAGVTAFIQPGGSKRDADTIAACDERGAAMIFTGTRHFKH